jgi:hypothetical protein
MRLVLVTSTILFLAGCAARTPQQQAERDEIHYGATLRTYQQVLTPGMTRKQVEDYLHAENVPYTQLCCVESVHKHSFDDITKIGHERKPWYCSENNVYVAFVFSDQHHHPNKHEFGDADEMDTLKEVSIFHWLEGCL